MEHPNDHFSKIRVITFSREKLFNEEKFNCISCNRSFLSLNALEVHKDIHKTDSHICDDCGQVFPLASNFIEHREEGSCQPPYNCGICTKSFNSYAKLRRHKMSTCESHISKDRYPSGKTLGEYKLNISCDTCSLRFGSLSKLIRHKAIHRIRSSSQEKGENTIPNDSDLKSPREFKCEDCEMTFKDKKRLISHKKTHVKSKDHECEFCRKFFSSSSYLNEHRMIHLGKNFECFVCKKVYSRRGILVEHMKIHTGERQHQCEFCGRRFLRSNTLHKHRTLHTGKVQKCETCERSFADKSTLNEHMKVHMVSEGLDCEYCGKIFYRRNLLIKHKKIHTADKEFECSTCGKKFSLQSELKKHSRSHTGERPYECKICSKHFSIISNLKRHEKLHSGLRPFECETCHKRFSSKGILEEHFRVHTGEKPFTCEFCQKNFSQRGSLMEHRRIHTEDKRFECEHCKKRFYQKSYLSKHLRVHTGEKPFECNVCQKRFSRQDFLKVHLKIHSGVKTHSCDLCPKIYMSRSELTKHKKIHILTKIETTSANSECNKELRSNISELTTSKFYFCKSCKLEFLSEIKFDEHNRSHVFESTEGVINEENATKESLTDQNIRMFLDNVGPRTYKLAKEIINKESFDVLKKFTNDAADSEPEMTGQNFFPIEFYEGIVLDDDKKCHVFLNMFQCEYCGEQFSEESHLIHHKTTHKVMSDEQGLTNVVSAPSESSPCSGTIQDDCFLQCEFCDQKFKVSDELFNHKLTHTKDDMFTCVSCNKSFDVSSNFQQPENLLNCEFHFECVQCSITFICGPEKPIKCPSCDKYPVLCNRSVDVKNTFANSEKYNLCDICGQFFTTACQLVEHKKLHSEISANVEEIIVESVSDDLTYLHNFSHEVFCSSNK